MEGSPAATAGTLGRWKPTRAGQAKLGPVEGH